MANWTRNILKAKYFVFRMHAKVKATMNAIAGYEAIYNVNAADETNFRRRALLIYLVKPFSLESTDPQLRAHQNHKRCKQIAALLDEFGYIVDAVDIRDNEFLPSKDYDLIISNRVDLKGMEAYFKEKAVKIYLASVANHAVHNRNLQRRHALLFQRRKQKVAVRRVYPEAMPYVLKSHAIVGIGNALIIDKWQEVFQGPTYAFNNYGFEETVFLETKDFGTARNNFLFFASGSQIQKGLDLLLEIFPKFPHLHLYICSGFKNEPDFCACYQKELYNTPNIHPVGWIRVNSQEFYDLVQKCAYVIHPTCSEGQAGSVVQCMYAGLIPLVTREAGIDTEHFGVTFSNDSLDEIEKVIVALSKLPDEWHRKHSFETRQVAEKQYSEDAFMNRWRQILTEILNMAGATMAFKDNTERLSPHGDAIHGSR